MRIFVENLVLWYVTAAVVSSLLGFVPVVLDAIIDQAVIDVIRMVGFPVWLLLTPLAGYIGARHKSLLVTCGSLSVIHLAFCGANALGTYIRSGEASMGYGPVLLIGLVPLGLLLYVGFREPGDGYAAGCCQRCNYDLTGNTSGRCPECGHFVSNS